VVLLCELMVPGMRRAPGEFEPGRLGACSPPFGFESWCWGVGGRSGYLAAPLLSGVSALTQSAISAKIRQVGIARIQVGDESRFRTMAAPLQGVVRVAESARQVMHANPLDACGGDELCSSAEMALSRTARASTRST